MVDLMSLDPSYGKPCASTARTNTVTIKATATEGKAYGT